MLDILIFKLKRLTYRLHMSVER